MKLEGFLRIANIPYQVIEISDPNKGPKGKLPYINDNGVIIGDSELIMDYLESKLDFNVDGHLGSQQKAMQHAFIRTLDEHLYWALVYSRWADESNWKTFKRYLFADIPPPISTLIAKKVRKQILNQLHQQGIGRHSCEDIYKKAIKDIEQLSQLLGDHQWFGGDYVSKLDLTALSYLSNMMIDELPSPLADTVNKIDNLRTYKERALAIIFPEEIKKNDRPW